MLKHPAIESRRLMFENCEQRLLLTDACSADATEPISSEELVAEVAPSEPDANTVATDDEIRTELGAADVSHDTSVDPRQGSVLVEVTVELVVPHEDVYELEIEQAAARADAGRYLTGPYPPPAGISVNSSVGDEILIFNAQNADPF